MGLRKETNRIALEDETDDARRWKLEVALGLLINKSQKRPQISNSTDSGAAI